MTCRSEIDIALDWSHAAGLCGKHERPEKPLSSQPIHTLDARKTSLEGRRNGESRQAAS